MDLAKLKRKDPARAWNVVYSLLIDSMDKKEQERFDSDLFRKPGGSTRNVGDKFDRDLRAAAAEYLKSLPPGFGQIDFKEDKPGEA